MDYIKNQEEAIAIVKQMIADGQISQEVAEKYFPELKESEGDEMIRKALVEHFKWNSQQILNEFANKEVLAWLEKQGEYAKFRDSIQVGDKVTRNQDGVLVNLSQLKRVAKPAEKQGK